MCESLKKKSPGSEKLGGQVADSVRIKEVQWGKVVLFSKGFSEFGMQWICLMMKSKIRWVKVIKAEK